MDMAKAQDVSSRWGTSTGTSRCCGIFWKGLVTARLAPTTTSAKAGSIGQASQTLSGWDPKLTKCSQKGYVWFVVEDTVAVPGTGKKGFKVRLLEEGIIPAWLDLNFMQVFAGGRSLGYMEELRTETTPATSGSVVVGRIQGAQTDEAPRKVIVKNEHSKLVFDDPVGLLINDFVDLGWAIHDCCYQGAMIRLSPQPGRWIVDPGTDEGPVVHKAAGPPRLCHGDGPNKVWAGEPKAALPYERRLAV